MRRRESVHLDVADLRRNPKAPQYGRHGAVFVRYGKSSKGSQPERRTIFTVPEMDWTVDVLDHYLAEVRPRFGAWSAGLAPCSLLFAVVAGVVYGLRAHCGSSMLQTAIWQGVRVTASAAALGQAFLVLYGM
ncbi:hypothetical protein ABT383_33945 [Streptomyces humidus]|uniref:hypothetical protein n=1 Tax=Streptomyces humidus TaxID=52259 RepID=UPI00167ECB7E|nr:hypothetical protein [Streptomyces humidus]